MDELPAEIAETRQRMRGRWDDAARRRSLADALEAARQGRPWSGLLHGLPDLDTTAEGGDLGGAPLSGEQLRDVMLPRVSFDHADCRDADLSGSGLRGARFMYADLRGARLVGADLSDAFLVGADLRDADLTDARLNGAALTAARLDRARFDGADLTGASLFGANVADADLSGADLTDAHLGTFRSE